MKQAFDRNGIEMPYTVKPRYLEELADRVPVEEQPSEAKDAGPRKVKSA
jgi:hypothetical protein